MCSNLGPKYFILTSLLAIVLSLGCQRNQSTPDKPSSATESKDYEIRGKVTAIGEDRKTITLDHEEIPNLMKGMEMEFQVENPQHVEGLQVGDQVEGSLKVESGRYVISDLQVSRQ